jgi:hypothetical protein
LIFPISTDRAKDSVDTPRGPRRVILRGAYAVYVHFQLQFLGICEDERNNDRIRGPDSSTEKEVECAVDIFTTPYGYRRVANHHEITKARFWWISYSCTHH